MVCTYVITSIWNFFSLEAAGSDTWQALTILPLNFTEHVPHSPLSHEYGICTFACWAITLNFCPRRAFVFFFEGRNSTSTNSGSLLSPALFGGGRFSLAIALFNASMMPLSDVPLLADCGARWKAKLFAEKMTNIHTNNRFMLSPMPWACWAIRVFVAAWQLDVVTRHRQYLSSWLGCRDVPTQLQWQQHSSSRCQVPTVYRTYYRRNN